MSRKNANRLAELKRAGFPFDPTRPSNWFAGILRSLLARNHPTDRVDLLAKQTLKQMSILTKGERREFILRQVESAIQQLCNKNVLLLYTPTRVRFWDGLSQTKLERYLNTRPVRWSDRALPGRIGGDPGLPEPDGDSEPVMGDTGDLFEDDAFPTLPKIGIAIDPISSDEGASTMPGSPLPESLLSPWAPEENRIIDSLLPRSHEDELEPTNLLPVSSTVENGEAGRLRGERDTSNSRLKDVVGAIQDRDESMNVFALEERTAVLDSSHGGQIDLEWRRGGELRIFVSFPGTELTKVLRHVGSRWLNLVVALDERGRHGVQRIIPADTAPSAVAAVLLKDVEALEDAMAAVQ